MEIGTKITVDGYNGTVIANSAASHYGHCPEGMVIVRLPGGIALRAISECAIAFRTELTPAGEQYVIPGAERDNEQARTTQLNLF